ncbi:MAG: DUF2605 domain-containing protein [Cyanosarcina radialis HA8281-LM2]|jgi:hypothetical protein|nr:DUF2605 domain-containing protein [Cyanosarcina radialis HA8281-LM2]
MSDYPMSEPELLKQVLKPLLEDFQYWFARSRSLLETENISFLSTQEQADLLERVKFAQQEVSTAQMMFDATDGRVGIETATMKPWHQLVGECWQVAMKWRKLKHNDRES